MVITMAENYTSKDVEAGVAEGSPPPYQQMPEDPIGGEAPPTYNAVGNADVAPPSYESLFGKVKAAKVESTGHVDFCKKFLIILLSTLGCTIAIGVLLAVPITMIVIGAKYKNDCPAERMIPIYLIVAGSFGIVKNLSNLGQRMRNKDREDGDQENAKSNPFDSILNCFLFAWFIAGNVWIYRTANEWSSNSLADNYCDPTLYYFAFWVTTATYILLGLVCCCVCFGGVLAACCNIARE